MKRLNSLSRLNVDLNKGLNNKKEQSEKLKDELKKSNDQVTEIISL